MVNNRQRDILDVSLLSVGSLSHEMRHLAVKGGESERSIGPLEINLPHFLPV